MKFRGYEQRHILSVAEIMRQPSYPAPDAVIYNSVSPAFIAAVVAAAQDGAK
jgi:hypothetical protein